MKRISILFLFLLFSCKSKGPDSPACQNGLKLAEKAAHGIAGLLECADYEAVKKDIMSPVAESSICKAPPDEQSLALAGSILCPPIAKYSVKLGKSSIPSAWECSAEESGEKMEALVEKGCRLLLDRI